MAVTEATPRPVFDAPAMPVSAVRRLADIPARRWLSAAAVSAMLCAVGVVHAIGMRFFPNYGTDEGTYVSRAWAVQTGLGAHGGPAPYTYWYDHPPWGWIQLTLWTWMDHTFRRGDVSVASARGAMLWITLVSALLVYVLVRRLGGSVIAGIAAMGLFGMSPLSVYYLRMVWLDCIGMPWVLGAFVLALSPKRSLLAYVASAACFASGVLSKETYLLLLPALMWQVWQRCDRSTRRVSMTAFFTVFSGAILYYPLWAALKGELLPGKGHVSLIGSVLWQLVNRPGSGSVFTRGSNAWLTISSWVTIDPWLLALGACSIPVAMFSRRLRPVACAMAIFVAEPLRGGYLPEPWVVGAIPFAAIVIAASGDWLWHLGRPWTMSQARGLLVRWRSRGSQVRSSLGTSQWWPGAATAAWRGVLAFCLAFLGWHLVPQWAASDRAEMTTNATTAFRQAERWIYTHVPRSDTFIVDNNVWTDLVDNGYQRNKVVWFSELDTDPQVEARFPQGWKQIDWVVATPVLRNNLVGAAKSMPSVVQALAHSTAVVRFGTGTRWVSIRKVHVHAKGSPPWWLPGYGSFRPPTTGPQKGDRL